MRQVVRMRCPQKHVPSHQDSAAHRVNKSRRPSVSPYLDIDKVRITTTMASATEVKSPAHFEEILKSSRVVVSDFYAEWCGPCIQIAPIYEELSVHLSIPNQITFTLVNVDTQMDIASKYIITAMPTFLVFKQGELVERIVGADTVKVRAVVQDLIAETKSLAKSIRQGSGNEKTWGTTDLPRGYNDITNQIDLTGLELLNSDSDYGGVRSLFDNNPPSGLDKQKTSITKRDWIESDTDEQLMLFIPFQSTLKIHSLQITSLPPNGTDEDEAPMRPKTIQIYPNRAQILGFDEADQCPATQTITLSDTDWKDDGTATLSLRFVKFQSVSTLTLFVVDGDGNRERTRIDRLRVIGEVGEKRDPGKLEKIGDD